MKGILEAMVLILLISTMGCSSAMGAKDSEESVSSSDVADNYDTIRINNEDISERRKRLEKLRIELAIETEAVRLNKENSGYMYTEPGIGVPK